MRRASWGDERRRARRCGWSSTACGITRLLVVDGYADLDPAGRPGVGARANAEFEVPVIGVARTAFRIATHAGPVLRGEGSTGPLFGTAAGMPRCDPADMVRHMAGHHRLPDALRRADARPPGPAMTPVQALVISLFAGLAAAAGLYFLFARPIDVGAETRLAGLEAASLEEFVTRHRRPGEEPSRAAG